MVIDTISEIKAAMTEVEYSGIIERTGEMRWAERSREWQPVYALTDLGRAHCPPPGSVSKIIKTEPVD